jgi:hypothetical protein
MSPKLTKELGLPVCRARKSINMQFAKSEAFETKKVVLYVILKCVILQFMESITFCEMDKVDFILVDIVFRTQW